MSLRAAATDLPFASPPFARPISAARNVCAPGEWRPSTATAELPFSLFQIAPPYDEIRHGGRNLAELRRLQPGALAGIHVVRDPLDWRRVQEAVRRVRATAPLAPVVLLLDPTLDVLHAATQVARMPVRAVLATESGFAGALRRQVTRPADLGGDVVEWLALRGIRLPPTVRHLLQGIFSFAPEHDTVGALLEEIGTSESSARFRLQKKALPPPGRWLQAARALHAALRLQERPERPLLPVAVELGYADHSALSHLLGRAFTTRPAEIRTRLGWEWLLDRWLTGSCSRYREACAAPEARSTAGS